MIERRNVGAVVPRLAEEVPKVVRESETPDSLFPEHLVKKARLYKAGYLVFLAMMSAIVWTTPRLEGSITGFVFIILLCVLSFLILQGSDPGYFEIGETTQCEMELTIPDSEIPMDSPPFQDSDSEAEDEDDDFELDIEPSALDNSNTLPPRAKFCRNSKRYVATFDHFCAVLGTCIGERNHFRFYWFLVFHTLGIANCLQMVQSGFRDSKAEVGAWLDLNSHALMVTIALVFLLIMSGSLLVFHTFLVLANMTSYEFLRADSISYLRGTKDFDLPFSRGLYHNLNRFCCLDGVRLFFVPRSEWRPRAWRVPESINRDSEDVWNNLWENKYWSCC